MSLRPGSTAMAVGLWLAGALAVRGLTALVVSHPGYLDAYYTYHVATRLAAGHGLTETVAWNFLTPPSVLPRPSNAFWPPGTALFVVAPWLLAHGLGNADFGWRWAQLGPVVVSAACVPVAYVLTKRLTAGPGAERRAHVVAWLLLFSGVYFPYWVTSDAFTPALLLGATSLWLATELVQAERRATAAGVMAGAAAGLLAAFRADGLLILVSPLLGGWLRSRERLRSMAAVLAGAVAGIAPLLLRNVETWGTIAPPGVTAALWLTRYEDLFAFLQLPLAQTLVDDGAAQLTAVRFDALFQNLGVLGQPLLYYLVPLTAWGAWRARRERGWWPVLAYVLALVGVMTVAFPFPGPRGSQFHSQVAVLPFLLVWTVVGLEAAVRAGARRRGWAEPQAQAAFSGALCGLAVVASLYFVVLDVRRWDSRLSAYQAVARWLDEAAPADARVMAIDPPGFWYASRRHGRADAGRDVIMVPSDGYGALTTAAERFGASYLLLERVAPAYLGPIYDRRQPAPDLEYLATVADIRVYRFLLAQRRLASLTGPRGT